MAVNDSSTLDLETMLSTTFCTSCSEGQADDDDKYCMTCHADCCISCITTSHLDHNILPRTHSIVRSMKLYQTDVCTSHKDEKLSMYCVTCKTPCCFTCIDESHEGHPMSTIKSIARQADSLYGKVVDGLAQTKSGNTRMKTKYKNYVNSLDEAIIAIKNQFQQLRMTIVEMEATMIQSLNNELKEVNGMQTDMEQQLLTAECLVQLYQSAKEEDCHFKKVIFFTNCPPLESLEFETDSFPEPVSFKHVSLDKIKTEQIVGSIVRSDGQLFKDEKSGSTCQEPEIFDVLNIKTIDISLDGKVFPTMQGQKWIVSRGDCTNLGTYWGYVYGSKFSFLDEKLNLREVFKVIEYQVSDASIIPPSDLVYTDWRHEQVWQISSFGTNRLVLDTSPMIPKGICVTKDKTLVLGLNTSSRHQTGRSLIRIYSLHSLKYIDEIEKDDLGKALFTSIRGILQTSNEDFIVDDDRELLCISKEGNLKWKLDNSFQYYCCDNDSNLIAATREEIQMFNSSGNYVQTLLTDINFLREPTSLSVDTDGSLWIGQDRSVKIVKYQNNMKREYDNTKSS